MRIAYCGHSYHRVTRSNAFLLEELRRRATVDEFWDESWLDGAEFDPGPVLDGGYDAVVVWQMEWLAARLAAAELRNLTFFPMYDGCHAEPDSYWRRLAGAKVVCFSSTLHERLQRLGVRTRHVRYYPEPSSVQVDHEQGLSGFFWQRQQDITWSTIRTLLGDAPVRMTLHQAMDPSYGEAVPPGDEDVRRWAIRTTRWFASREEATAELRRHSLYFAPRMREGIGLSFLEAMAMGAVVVAADRPTMSEYIVSGVNGLLFDPQEPRPLDFSRHAALGRRARAAVEAGREVWLRCLPPLLDLLATPTARVAPAAPLNALDPRGLPRLPRPAPAAPRMRSAAGDALPRVTVAVVTLNADSTLGPTLESILAQDWPELEVIVQDGGSTDGTMAIVRAYADRLDAWRSEPDGGPYHAMNAAARRATGRFIVFMNAGDSFHSTDAITRAMSGVPAGADIVFGHHVYRDLRGNEEIHAPADFAETWGLLRSGHIGWRWQSRVPGHQATFTSTELLRAHPYRADLRIAADHELLYRAARGGATFHHTGTIVATYAAGGFSWRNRSRCFEEWRQIALEYSEHPERVEAAFARMRQDVDREELPHLTTGRVALRIGRTPGATRELKRRIRIRLRRLRPVTREARWLTIPLSEDWPDGLLEVEGLSAPESWGRWTEGKRALLRLEPGLGTPRTLSLEIHDVFGPNVGKPLHIRVGDYATSKTLRRGRQRLRLKLPGQVNEPDRIEVEVPEPAAPRDYGYNDDPRALGVALSSLELRLDPAPR